MNRDQLIKELENYKTPFTLEKAFVPRFLSLLQNFEHCYDRSLSTGHMTGSALITTLDLEHILLIHHKKLNRWLQPGGHADGNENILDVARKEAEEEAGILDLDLATTSVFDIDIHQIPFHNQVKTHFHYDIRFLFKAPDMKAIKKNHESNDIEWIPLSKISTFLGNDPSITRMCEKVNSIKIR